MGIQENRKNGKNLEHWHQEISPWFDGVERIKRSDREGGPDFECENNTPDFFEGSEGDSFNFW